MNFRRESSQPWLRSHVLLHFTIYEVIEYIPSARLVLDGAICPADSFEFTVYHCMKLNAFKHEWASFNRIATDKSHSIIVAYVDKKSWETTVIILQNIDQFSAIMFSFQSLPRNFLLCDVLRRFVCTLDTLARPNIFNINNIVIWTLGCQIETENSLKIEEATLWFLAHNIKTQQS